ncbi:MAG: hypothetical protein ACN6I5_05030 [Hyphomicrobiales bacterium]
MTQTLANDRLAVDRPWLDAMMEEVSAFGATGEPGALNRMAATTEHGKARDWLCSLMERRGYEVRVDPVGNVFGVLETAGPDAPLVLVGSHLDSQPNGGRFDGAYGVVAALAAIEAVRAHLDARGEAPGCNYAVVDWTNEEGRASSPAFWVRASMRGNSSLISRSPARTATASRWERNWRASAMRAPMLRPGPIATSSSMSKAIRRSSKAGAISARSNAIGAR